MDVFALNEQPIIKCRAIGKRKPIQKRSTHECHRLSQAGSAFGAILRLPGMSVSAAGFDQVSKEGYIQLVPAKRVELQIEAVRDQVGLGIVLGFLKIILQL